MDEEVKTEEQINKENIVDFPTEAETCPEHVEDESIQAEEEKDDVYRLDEMADEMEQSILNVKKVLENQKQLVDYVAKAEGNMFGALVNELNMSNSNLEGQVSTMTERHDLLVEVVETCRNDENVKNVVNKLLSALGVFRQ